MTEITFETTASDVASRSLRVTVPAERLSATEAKTVREYRRRAKLPGFRAGHAPEAVVRRRFADDIRRHVLEEALRESWDTVLKSSDARPIADPQVRDVRFESGEPLTFELMFEVRPSIALANTGGFSLSRNAAPVTPDMVQEQLERLREQRATWEPGGDDQPKPGNMVSVSVAGPDDQGDPSPHEVVLGQGQTIPEVEELIMSLRPGQSTEGDVRFPDDHPDESRRGTSRHVRITLHEVKRQNLPDLNDALARELGDFDSVDSLRTRVQQDLESDAARTADREVRDQLIDALARANDVPAPASMVHRLMHSYAEAYKIDPAQFETFAQSFQPLAEGQVRRELILDAVATAQNLHATEADIDARVAQVAASRGTDTAALYASLQRSNRLAEVERSLTEDKVFDWLLGQSTVTEVTA